MNCASGRGVASPAQALAWDKASADRNISITLYQSDGTTVIGTFHVVTHDVPTISCSTPKSETQAPFRTDKSRYKRRRQVPVGSAGVTWWRSGVAGASSYSDRPSRAGTPSRSRSTPRVDKR